ncbi:cell-cycle regulation histidine triad HIT protein [Lentibacillus amyloliquefaciens]|uniref:Cell-cycle regulation histidine triad HIT protein n=1 Tax=Lentibacillus amyloliquefaciens TaxID=1472767 RepID=A0A0U4FV09_9BACI|nr:cell-cycle regulation histidine triad HIT protein [Lentibacillus amyloliquefaciens]
MYVESNCVFCEPKLEADQKIILSNDYCMFLQLDQARIKGVKLEGAGLIVPKTHRQTAFDLSLEEWQATYELLPHVKKYIDETYQPDGYNLGWNCGEISGQHIPHAHLHVLPRYADEPLAGKGIRYMFKNDKNERKGFTGLNWNK